MGSSERQSISTRDRQLALLKRVVRVSQLLDDRRLSAGYSGQYDNARAFQAMRDELRAVGKEWETVFADEDNVRESADFMVEQNKSSEKVEKHAGQNRF